MADFGSRLAATMADRSALCLGIDPHPFLLAEWGLTDSAAGVREFALRAVDAAAASIGIVKPQVAFFERFGAAGYAALEETIAAARAAELLVIADVKRGDIGSTVEAYAQAWLGPTSPLQADAMTVVAYQGLGSLTAPIAIAAEHGRGLFVLAATSNPEAAPVQRARMGEPTSSVTVAGGIVSGVEELNRAMTAGGLGSIGVVLGATVDLDDYGIDPGSIGRTPVLAPGFGEQGASVDDLRARFGAATGQTIVTLGRGLLRSGPEGLPGAVAATARAVRAAGAA